MRKRLTKKPPSGFSADPSKLVLTTKWVPTWTNNFMYSTGAYTWGNVGVGGVQDFSWDFGFNIYRAVTTPYRLRFWNLSGSAFPLFCTKNRTVPGIKVAMQNADYSSSVNVSFKETSSAQSQTTIGKEFNGFSPLISEPISTKNLSADTWYNCAIVCKEVPRNTSPINNDFMPNPQGLFSRATNDALNTAKWKHYRNQDIIANTRSTTSGTPNDTGTPTFDILTLQNGSTRKAKVAYMYDSLFDNVSHTIHERLVNFDYCNIGLGHAGASPYDMFGSSLVNGISANGDIIVNGLAVNLINPQALISGTYFGGATVTNTKPMVDDLIRTVKTSGNAWFQLLPYPIGLDVTSPLAQTKSNSTISITAYDRCIDYRNKLLTASSDDVGRVIDYYAPILDYNPGNPSLPITFKADDIGGGLKGINIGELEPDVFRFTCTSYASNRFDCADIAADGNWLVPPLTGYNHPLTNLQRECFGDGRWAKDDVSLGCRSNRNGWTGAKLVCISGDPSVVGQVLTINLVYPVWGQSFVFSCNEGASGTYAGSVWEMRIVLDADNKGSTSQIPGLHVTLPYRSYCDWMFWRYTLKPYLLSLKGID